MRALVQADVAAMTAAITSNTVLMVGSAPGYPFGIMDNIEEIAAVAHSRKLLMHVDACYGGFVLPWLEKIGQSHVPPYTVVSTKARNTAPSPSRSPSPSPSPCMVCVVGREVPCYL